MHRRSTPQHPAPGAGEQLRGFNRPDPGAGPPDAAPPGRAALNRSGESPPPSSGFHSTPSGRRQDREPVGARRRARRRSYSFPARWPWASPWVDEKHGLDTRAAGNPPWIRRLELPPKPCDPGRLPCGSALARCAAVTRPRPPPSLSCSRSRRARPPDSGGPGGRPAARPTTSAPAAPTTTAWTSAALTSCSPTPICEELEYDEPMPRGRRRRGVHRQLRHRRRPRGVPRELRRRPDRRRRQPDHPQAQETSTVTPRPTRPSRASASRARRNRNRRVGSTRPRTATRSSWRSCRLATR